MQRKKLSIAIPASVVSDTPHLREKTTKIGLIGRAASIFRVNEIMIYPDNPKVNQKAEMSLIASLLEYMETPQYLRKHLFKLKPELRYAGILPPLRTAHHPLNRKISNLKIGDYREGVVLTETKNGVLVDIGVETAALLPNKQLPINKRVTVRITRTKGRLEVELANRDEIPVYWGYNVFSEKESIGKLLKSRNFELTIATSRYGVPFNEVSEVIKEKWSKAKDILIAFGPPTQGLHEILKNERLLLVDVVDFIVNTIPNQGTETVRTEEALLASLAVFNQNFCL